MTGSRRRRREPTPDSDTRCGRNGHSHGPERARRGRRGRSGPDPGLTRRAVLVGGVGVAAGLAGCLGGAGGEGAPEPVSLGDDDRCEVCGMVIPLHPGPTAEIFYADHEPSGHPNPARFDSTWEAFQYDFERQNRGWTRETFYVTDYAAVDYELTRDAGDTLISTHVAADAFVAAAAATFVVGSAVKGAMGRDLLAFSEREVAEQFRRDHGGDLAAFEDVTEATIRQLAGQ
jgi:nitrous oxide reductase accessory protein NosL